MKHPIRNLFLIVLLIIVVLIVQNGRKESRYKEVLAVNPELTNAERAEKMRSFGKFKDAPAFAAFYQALADHDFAAAGEIFMQNDFAASDWYYYKLKAGIEAECESGDALLSALREGYVPYVQPDDDLWALWESSIISDSFYFNLLGCEDTAALADACGGAPDGKLLVVYAQTGEELLYHRPSGEYGANLSAMASLGEGLWPSSLSEVEYLLRVEYQMPAYSSTGQGNTTVRYRGATMRVTLTHLTDGEKMYENTLSGDIPQSVWVGQGANAEYTYFPKQEKQIAALDEALAEIGASTGIRR